MKANFDIAFRGTSRGSCSRVVIRDSKGQFLSSCTHPHNNVPLQFAVEALAFLVTVSFASDLDFSMVELEGDSLHVINRLRSSQVDYSEIRSLVMEARTRLLTDFVDAIFYHYFRE